MLQSLLIAVLFYVVWTLNLSTFINLLNRGYFQHRFFTRSIRSVFSIPPFGFAAYSLIFLWESVGKNFRNYSIVMKKREFEL